MRIATAYTFLLFAAIDAGADCGTIIRRAPAPCHTVCATPVKQVAPVVEAVVVAPAFVPVVATTVIVPAYSFQFLPALSPYTATVNSATVNGTSLPMSAGPSQISSASGNINPGLAGAQLPQAADPDEIPAWDAASSQPTAQVPSGTTFASVLQRNCISCHGGGQAKGGVSLFARSGEFMPSVPYSDIAAAIQSGRMPPKSQPRLAANELALFQASK